MKLDAAWVLGAIFPESDLLRIYLLIICRLGGCFRPLVRGFHAVAQAISHDRVAAAAKLICPLQILVLLLLVVVCEIWAVQESGCHR